MVRHIWEPQRARRGVEILYLAWNRLEYTAATWAWLVAHTNWKIAERIVIYDDGSEDGTLEWLRDEAVPHAPVPVELRATDLRSPPAIMNHYLASCEAAMFAKVDNDIALPPGWLDAMHNVIGRHPGLDALGMEAGMSGLPDRDVKLSPADYTILDCSHIGGVGLIRRNPLRLKPRIPERGRFGWTEHQQRHNLGRAWITPDLPVLQLDRIGEEPWASLAELYVEQGWQREWGKYDPSLRPYYEWTLPELAAA